MRKIISASSVKKVIDDLEDLQERNMKLDEAIAILRIIYDLVE